MLFEKSFSAPANGIQRFEHKYISNSGLYNSFLLFVSKRKPKTNENVLNTLRRA